MTIKSGLSAQLGIKKEVTYGTFIAPDRFHEFNNESLQANFQTVQSLGIGIGRFQRSGRYKRFAIDAAGDVEIDLLTTGFGALFEQMFGDVATVGAAAPYTHTYTPDDDALQGLSFTTQVGRPDVGGTVRAFSYLGCKVTGWEFTLSQSDPARLRVSLDARTEVTSEALAAASYPVDDELWIYSEGALTIAGSAFDAKSITLRGTHAMDTGRRFIGSANKKEPIANAEWMYEAVVEAEFESMTQYNNFKDATELEDLVLTLTSPTEVTPSNPYKLTYTIPQFAWQEGAVTIGGPQVVPQSLTAKAIYNGTDPVISAEHVTDEATP